MDTKYKKVFEVQTAKAKRHCMRCSKAINRGQKCLTFSYSKGYTFQVTASICKECINEILSNMGSNS